MSQGFTKGKVIGALIGGGIVPKRGVWPIPF